ncbi:Tetratricopeptide repeat domain-containing protein [Lasiodiplodia theobromae]|uniref:Tetratricopeptide repeat domain-containing protein n=1 Tax=Lasiodiplodia theobromae TaxID=45133 RepID=UPI0015C31203|nr:Tetratricopeptide repeat domain-containing protein [Lasiodiplodia theobromae]KAF4539975.1 Tetratricopeptide repeat domain-containing protein [Lasiodiplodia theobromae]
MSSSSPKYLTVLDAGGLARISGSWLTGQLQAFRACDTFQPDFLRGILFTTSTEDAALEPQARAVLRNAGVEWTSVLSKSSHDQSALRPGPYLSSRNFLFELRRIHDDTHECFVTTVIQAPSIQPCFQSLPFGSSDRATAPAAAVPSRLTTSTAATTANLPLAGLRIAVKDNFDLAGITTSLCNAAYASFHPPAAVTAACVQRLVDRGATVLGKTRLSSFAATEEPLECIDWPAPWNPRADGYQSPAGSSSGSGAAVAAYEWLDAAVGSDNALESKRRWSSWNRGGPSLLRLRLEVVGCQNIWKPLVGIPFGTMISITWMDFEAHMKGMASKISRAERDDATDKLEVYRNWFTEKIMRVKESNTIVILPIEEISPRYRDEPPSRKFYPKGVPMLFLSPIIGGPELTIPIGQVPPQSIFVLVPGVGTKAPNKWYDESERLWLNSLPPAISAGVSAYAFNHDVTPRHFAWPQLFGQGERLLKQLVELGENQAKRVPAANGAPKVPIVIIAHSVGGFIIKEALCSAFEQKNQYRDLLETLAGVIFLGTPHSISRDDEVWDNIPYAIDQSYKAKNLINSDARQRLAQLSSRFMQAAAGLQVLSCYEVEKTKVKSSLLSSSKILIAPREFVQLKFSGERVLALRSDHRGLCDFRAQSSEFADLAAFIETALEDARLRIANGSPEYDVPEALATLTVKDVSDIDSLDHEKGHNNSGGGNSSAEPPSDPRATKGSSDAAIGDINDVANFSSTLPNPKLPCHIIPSNRNPGFFGRADVLRQLDEIFLEKHDDNGSVSSSGKEMTMFALVGPGGMGKTQIATEFVHLRKDRFDAIFWVYADQSMKVSDGFSKIALELGLVSEDSADAKDPVVVRENVKGWMSNPVKSYEASETSIEKASWLLVFDNADDADIIGDYWPVDGPGCVLLTSRYPLHLDSIEDSILQPFSTADAFNFLIKLTKRKDDPGERQAGMEVVSRLGGLPLAVTQMAGIITRRDLSFVEFLAAYDERENQEDLFKTKMENPLTRRKSEYEHTLASLMNYSEGLEGLESDMSSKFRLAKLLTDSGWFYHESGNSLEALPLYEKAQRLGEYVERNLKDELFTDDTISSEDVTAMLAEIHHNMGCVATETNKPTDAVHHFTVFNEMMAEEARTSGKQKEFAISWNELGIAKMMNKEWADAEKCFLRSIEIMEEVDASAKELKSLPTVNLGLSYWLQDGRLEEADAVLTAGLRDREAIYGVNDRESFM